MLGNTRGKLLNKYVSDYSLFDLETTGLSSRLDQIIEISAVKVRNGEIVAEFSRLVNPCKPIPYAASSVNHITDEMVADSPTIAEVFPEFLEFVGDDILVGHNISSFDMKFIYRDCDKIYGETINNDYIDTHYLAKTCFPDWPHRRLCDLADYYGVETQGAHRALADCKMNQKVFEGMGKDINNLSDSQKAADKMDVKVCKRCGMLMKRRKGPYGEFFGCSMYPVCKYTETIAVSQYDEK